MGPCSREDATQLSPSSGSCAPSYSQPRAIYNTFHPTEEWTQWGFEEAQRFGTAYHRQALGATQEARLALTAEQERQLLLSVVL